MVASVGGNGAVLSQFLLGASGREASLRSAGAGGGVDPGLVKLALPHADDFLAAITTEPGLLRTYGMRGELDAAATRPQVGLIRQIGALTGELNRDGSTVSRIDGNGKLTVYRYVADAMAYLCDELPTQRIVSAADQQWLWQDGDEGAQGRYEVYDAASGGRILSAHDSHGILSSYRYNDAGLVNEVAQAGDAVTRFEYDQRGNLLQLQGTTSDREQITVRYSYDGGDRLTDVHTTLGSAAATDGSAQVYSASYSYAGASNRVTSITRGDGERVEFAYQEYPDGWRLSRYTDSQGHVTLLDHSVSGRLALIGVDGAATVYAYDDEQRLAGVTLAEQGGFTPQLVFSYAEDGKLQRVLHADGREQNYRYDQHGNRIAETDEHGALVVSREYRQPDNYLVAETRYGADGSATTTHFEYDNAGRLRFASAGAAVQEIRYDSEGRRIADLLYSGVSREQLSSLDELAAWTSSAEGQASGSVVRAYTYDARGLLDAVADGSSVRRHVYDQNGLLIQTISDAQTASYIAYDDSGRVQAIDEGEGRAQLNSYDASGGRVGTTVDDGAQSVASIERDGMALAVRLNVTAFSSAATGEIDGTEDAEEIRGTDGNDTIRGGGGADTIYGEDGDDDISAVGDGLLIHGGAGDDSVSAQGGHGELHGDDGNDTIIAHGDKQLIDGGEGNDLIQITRPDGNDTIHGGMGDDTIVDFGGNDLIRAGDGNDSISDYGGNDSIFAGAGNDTVFDQSGDDMIDLGEGGNKVTDLSGNDTILAGAGDDSVFDQSGDDVINVGDGNNTISDLSGNDTISAGAGNDSIFDYGGNDLIYAGEGNNTIDNHGGDDYLQTGSGDDRISDHGDGNDTIYAGDGNNTVEDFGGNDFIQTGRGDDRIMDQGAGADYINAGDGNNRIDDFGGNDTIRAGKGHDAITDYGGDDDIDAGDGNNTIQAFRGNDRIVTGTGNDSISSYDGGRGVISSGAGNDTISIYSPSSNVIDAGAGNDRVAIHGYRGASAVNSITLGTGNDVIESYYSTDTYYFNRGDGLDTIFDADNPEGGNDRLLFGPGISREHVRLSRMGDDLVVRVLDPEHPGQFDQITVTQWFVGHDLEIETFAFADGSMMSSQQVDALFRPYFGGLGLENMAPGALQQIGVGSAMVGQAGEAVILNTGSGNLVVQNQDDILASAGLDLGLVRTYNSQGTAAGAWQIGLDRSIRIATVVDGMLIRANGDGSEGYFNLGYDGIYRSTDGAGAYDTISYDSGSGLWTWIDGATGVKETYDAANQGRLVSSTDRSGNTTAYDYGINGLKQVTDASGDKIVLLYDGAGRLASVRSEYRSAGQLNTSTRVYYDYDGYGRLATVTTDLSPDDNSIADGKVYTTKYTYEGDSSRLSTISQSDRSSLLIRYQQDASSGAWWASSVTDAAGRTTSLSRGASGNTLTGPSNHQIQYSYDRDGNLQAVSDLTLDLATQYIYSPNGDLRSLVDARGISTSYQYDAAGNQTTRHVWNPGVNTQSLQVTYGLPGQVLTETVSDTLSPGQTFTTRYVYDAQGRLRFTLSPEGRVSELRYDELGNISAKLAYADRKYDVSWMYQASAPGLGELLAWLDGADFSGSMRTDYRYDMRGQLQQAISYNAVSAQSGEGVLDGRESVQQYVYDAAGQLLQTIDARGRQVSHGYDGLGRLLTTLDSAVGQATTTVYDDAGMRTVTTGVNGNTVISEYDHSGRLVQVTRGLSGASVGATTRYAYDASGRLSTVELPSGQHSYILYDAADRKVAEIDADGSMTEYYYNNGGLLSRSRQYLHRVDMAMLDRGERDIDMLRPDSGSADRSNWYVYDLFGRVTDVADALGYVTHTSYNASNNVEQLTRSAAQLDLSQLEGMTTQVAFRAPVSADDRVTRYFYDQDGRQTGVLEPEGALTENSYDAAGRLVQRTRSSSYPWARANGTLDQLRSYADRSVSHFLYDAKGQLVATVDPLGYLTETVYDKNGNVQQQLRYQTAVMFAAGATLETLRPQDGKAETTAYTYTARNQVETQITPDGMTVRYEYDALGNTKSETRAYHTEASSKMEYHFDDQGRLAFSVAPGGATVSYSYDLAGRRLSMTDAGDARILYFYDGEGRLAHTVNALGEVYSEYYNAFNQLERTVSYARRLDAATLGGLAGGDAAARGTAGKSLLDLLASLAGDDDKVVQYEYGKRGEVIAQTDAQGGRAVTAYNGFGEIRSTTVYAATTADAAHDASTRRFLDKNGRLAASLDGAGALTVYRYATNGNLSERISYAAKVDPLTATEQLLAAIASDSYADAAHDQHQRYLYDARGQLSASFTALSAQDGVQQWSVATHRYDAYGNKVGSTIYAKPVSVALPDAGTLDSLEASDHDAQIRYTYDGANRVTVTATAQGRADGQPLSWSLVQNDYDQAGRLVAVRGLSKQLLTADAVELTLGAGHYSDSDALTRYAYDSGNRLAYTAVAQGQDAAGGMQWAVRHTSYDASGRVSAQTDYATSLADKPAAQSVADWMASVALDGARDRTSLYSYDLAGRLAYSIDAIAGVVGRSYDAFGQLVRLTSYATPAPDTLAAGVITAAFSPVSDVQDSISYTVYDRNGRPAYQIDAERGVTAYRYDQLGKVTATHRFAVPLGQQQLADLLTGGPGILSGQLESLPLQADVEHDRVTTYLYDQQGRERFSLDASGYLKETRYDGLGQVASKLSYSGKTTLQSDTWTLSQAIAEASEQERLQTVRSDQYEYDAQGHLSKVTDALQASESYRYDGAGRKISFINKLGNEWRYEYDNAGRLTLERTPAVTVVDAGGAATVVHIETRIRYDALGNVAARTETAVRDDDGRELPGYSRTTSYSYDLAGRQTVTHPPLVPVYDAAQDPLSLSSADRVDSMPVAAPAITVSYDALGNAVSNVDVLGHITRKVYDRLGQVAFEIDAKGQVTGYRRNAQGDVTALTRYAVAPDWSDGDYSKAAVERKLESLAHGQDRVILTAYDRNGLAQKVTEPTSYAYGAHSGDQASAAGYAMQAKVTLFERNAFGELVRQRVFGDSSDPVAETRYYYNTVGQQVALYVLVNAGADASGYLSEMAYDDLGQLVMLHEHAGLVAAASMDNDSGQPVAAHAGDRLTRYGYDKAGRKISEDREGVAVDSMAGGSAVRGESTVHTGYEYDAVGNLQATRDALGGVTYRYYDVLGRLSALAMRAGVDPATLAGLGAAAATTPIALTEYVRDAYGNVVRTLDHARSALDADRSHYVAPDSHAGDRQTLTVYNLTGQALAVTDAEGHTVYSSYDIAGRLAKQWQSVTLVDNGGVKLQQTNYQVTRYDSLGQVSEVLTPAASTRVVTATVTGSIASSASSTPTSNGESSFSGENTVVLKYPDLGERPLRIQLNYRTFPGYVTENGQIPVQAYRGTQTFDFAAGAGAGATLRWSDAGAIVGGVASIDSVRILVQNAGGQWELAVFDNAAPVPVAEYDHGATTPGALGAIVASAHIADNFPDGSVWNGDNTVSLQYPDYGGQELRVELSYRSYDGYIYDENQRLPVRGTLRTETLTIPAGHPTSAIVSWRDSFGYAGGLKELVGVRILTKNAAGEWTHTTTHLGYLLNEQTRVVYNPDSGLEPTTQKISYNAFGEVIGRSLNGIAYEYAEYDNAGHVWRTNAGDGVDKVMVYNLTGQAALVLRSSAKDGAAALKSYATVQQVVEFAKLADDLRNGIVRNETRFDLMGRAIEQTGAAHHVAVTGDSRVTPVAVSASVAGSAQWNGAWTGNNSLDVALTLPAIALGSGDIKIEIAYHSNGVAGSDESYGTDATANAYSATLRADQLKVVDAATGRYSVQLNWKDTPPVDALTRTRVYKKDVSGAWQLLSETSISNGAPVASGGPYLAMPMPEDGLSAGMLEVTPSGASQALLIRGVNYGDGMLFDLSALSAGAAQYRLLFQASNAVAPEVRENGMLQLGAGGATRDITRTVAERPAGQDAAVRAVSRQRFDRWGNVVEVSDPRNPDWFIRYSYNDNNQMIAQQQVMLGHTDGATVETVSTLAAYYFDALGRDLGNTDGNSNLLRKVYGTDGNVVFEHHADGGLISSRYNLFGERTSMATATEGSAYVETTYGYDHLGRLSSLSTLPVTSYQVLNVSAGNGMILNGGALSALTERYSYDELGRRLSVTDGARATSYMRYDHAGNLVESTDATGIVTRYSYDAFGHRTGQQNADDTAMVWQNDQYGHVLLHVDLGGATTRYTYNGLGLLTSQYSEKRQSIAQQNLTYTYDGGLLTQIEDVSNKQVTTYVYDLSGRRIREKMVADGQVVQDNHIAYDALGRMTHVADSRYDVQIKYDGNGNRKEVLTSYVDGQDVAQRIAAYNAYDQMNRQTVVNGTLVDGKVVGGFGGHELSYDYAGNRKSDRYYADPSNSATLRTDSYSYDTAGRLTDTYRDGYLIDRRYYDAAGRIVRSGVAGEAAGEIVLHNLGIPLEYRVNAYDDAGRILRQKVRTVGGGELDDIYYGPLPDRSKAENERAGYDKAGNLKGYYVVPKDNQPQTQYSTSYQLFDSYKETLNRASNSGGMSIMSTIYDGNGYVVRVQDMPDDAATKVRDYINDAAGRVLVKTEGGTVTHTLIVNGEVLGSTSNKPGEAASSFASTYQPSTSGALSAGPSAYTVQIAGETPRTIAQSIWGDGKLWYLIADANRLQGDEALAAGTLLRLPARVNTVHNDYQTFKPYDAGEAVGNTVPTMPVPAASGGGGCGGVGTLIMAVVAVVVTVYTGYLAVGWLGGTSSTAAVIGGSAIGAAAGSAASQGVGIAIGAQDTFSWKSVGMAAIGGAVTAGVGAFSTTTSGAALSGPSWQATAARAALSNAVTQGIGNLTGMQQGFSWSSVAASSAGAAVGSQVGGSLEENKVFDSVIGQNAANIARASLTGFAAGITTAIARGGKIAVTQIATDAFGNALGSSLARNIIGTSDLSSDASAGIRQDVMSGDRTAALNGPGSPMRSWSGDGEIMADFDPSGRIYANENEYQNRDSAYSPNYVTSEQVRGADGTLGLRATDAVRNAYVDALDRVKTMDVKQIFNANDPHQYLIFVSDDGTRNDANQAIPTNPRTLFSLAQAANNERVVPIYVSGVGTENDLGGLNSALGLGASLQISQTTSEITRRVNSIAQADPDAKFVFADTGFSRGAGVIRAVQNVLVQQGVPDLSSAYDVIDGDTTNVAYGRNIIEPGKVNIGASLIYDTVQTGTLDLMNTRIPSQVQQTLHLTASNEYRDLFPLTSALSSAGTGNSSVVEWSLPGAHSNIGGGSYDWNGIGAANLEIGYTYLQRAGVPLAPLPTNRLPDPSQFVIYDSRFVHSTPFDQLVNNPGVQRVIKYHK